MKDPLEYLNDAHIDLSDYDNYVLNDLEKQKMKITIKKSIKDKNRFKKYLGLSVKLSVLVASLVVCTLVFSISFPAYAEKIPVLKSVVEFLNKNDQIEGYQENVVPVMASIAFDDYTLNIESAYYNGKELTFFYNIVGKKPLNPSSRYFPDFKLDLGKGATCEYSLEYSDLIDEKTFAGMVTVFPSYHDGSQLPDILEGGIDFTKLNITTALDNHKVDSKDIDIVSEPIPLSLDKGDIEIKEHPINKDISYKNNSTTILNAKEYPTGLFIEYSSKINNQDINLDYYVWDSKKGHLQGVVGSPHGSEVSYFQYRLPSEDSEVFLIPHVADYSFGDIPKKEVKLEKGKYDFDKFGTLEILDVKDVGNTTEIKVRLTGSQSYGLNFVGDEIQTSDPNMPTIDAVYCPVYEKDKKILGILDIERTYVFNKLDRELNYYINFPSCDFKILEDQIIKIK